MITKILKGNGNYLSGYVTELPSHCLINKGITGCGGTTLELESKRDSIILCPTKNLVTSKSALGYFGVDGTVTRRDIELYLMTEKSYKKIIATYDALEKLMDVIPNYHEYFLLIDEYHLLFNDYSFRSKPIMFILNNFTKFKDWAFMTATPLKEEFILNELKDIEQVTYQWADSTLVNINIRDTCFIQKELLNLISLYKDRNLHIFLNSVTTIKNIISKLDTDDYRIVCSENSKTKITNFSKITSPVKKLNFYTSCAFEGCDIFDENGYTIIISDTTISTTVLDISTKIRQVCGRIRNSKYKDQVTLILNTNKHRYAGTTDSMFYSEVAKSEKLGKIKSEQFKKESEDEKQADLRLYNRETFSSIYLNLYDDIIFYDENLKKLDIYNYNLISEIYNNSISVLNECTKYNFKPGITKHYTKGLNWTRDKIKELDKYEYTYQELEDLFKELFKEHNLIWDKNNSIKKYFPEHVKKRKTVNNKRETYYIFNL